MLRDRNTALLRCSKRVWQMHTAKPIRQARIAIPCSKPDRQAFMSIPCQSRRVWSRHVYHASIQSV